MNTWAKASLRAVRNKRDEEKEEIATKLARLRAECLERDARRYPEGWKAR